MALIGTFVILAGISGAFALALNWSVLTLDAAHPEAAPTALRKFLDDPSRLASTKVHVVVGAAASLTALVAGFRLFALRPWARRAVMCWAAYVLVTNLNFILRGDFATGATVEFPFAALGFLAGRILVPTAALLVLTRRSVAAAFAPAPLSASLRHA